MKRDAEQETETRSGPRYAVPAVAKAMEVISLLAGEVEGLSMSEIAQRLDRTMGEIYRVVLELERLGYVLKDPTSDRRSLSLKLFELAHRHPPTERLIRLAQPILDELAAEIDQSCHLAVLAGDQLLIVAKADSPREMHYSVKLGARFPVLETSSGVVMLASRPATENAPLLAGLSPVDRRTFAARLNAALATGRERRPSAVVAGIVNLSAPILDHAGRAIAALTVPYLEQLRLRTDIDGAERHLLASAERLSRSLGAAAAPGPQETS